MGGPHGLPPQARLHSAGEFTALRHAPGRVDTRHFLLRYRANGVQARLGLAVSRRVSKRAVQRNRIKRVVRESFRHECGKIPMLDILIIARAHAAEVENRALRADLERAWPRLLALKPEHAPGTIAG